MYAIIRDGGRQFKIEEQQELTIDFREDLSTGDQVTFDEVLAISTGEQMSLGKPTLDGAAVTAEVVGVTQGPKLVIQKMRRRTHNSRTRTGHRQLYTQVKIASIDMPGLEKDESSAKKPADEEQQVTPASGTTDAGAMDAASSQSDATE